jgi:hypothetical protein
MLYCGVNNNAPKGEKPVFLDPYMDLTMLVKRYV